MAFKRLVLDDRTVDSKQLETGLHDLLESLTGDPEGFGAWIAQYTRLNNKRYRSSEKDLAKFLQERNGFF